MINNLSQQVAQFAPFETLFEERVLKMQLVLDKTVIERNAWQSRARESEKEAKELERRLNEAEDRAKQLGDQNRSMMQTCEKMTSERDEERVKREEEESRLDKLRSENAELVQQNTRARKEAMTEQEVAREKLDMKTRYYEDLETKLTDAEAENIRFSERISELEDRVQKLGVVAHYAQDLRVGFYHTGLIGPIHREIMTARNKAAHYGNIHIDILLFELGFITDSEKGNCNEKYAVELRFSIDEFIDNNEMLQALAMSAWADVLNMHAYLHSELKFEMKSEHKSHLDELVVKFRELEEECLKRYKLLRDETSELEALRNFSDEDVKKRLADMDRIVQQFRKIRRDGDGRPR
jgi:hypothetical protein